MSQEVIYQRKWFHEGELISQTDPVTYTIAIGGFQEQSSVDTGIFEPGVFRINPYTATRSHFFITKEGGTVIVKQPSGDNIMEDHYVGPVHWWLTRSRLSYRVNALNKISFKDMKDLGPHVLQEAMGKVGRSRLQLAVEVGELKETLEMLRSPFKNLRNFFWNNKRKNLHLMNKTLDLLRSGTFNSPRKRKSAIRNARRIGRDTLFMSSDTWLEYRYGLRPIISSIQDVMKEIDRKRWVFDANKIRTARALRVGAPKRWNESYRNTHNYLSYYYLLQIKAVMQFNASVAYRREYEQTVAQAFMLSPEYLPEIIWELTRLSFVVDWIFSIGPWLSSYRIKPGIRILGNTVGRKKRTYGIAMPLKSFYEGTYIETIGADSCAPLEHERSTYARTCNEDLSMTPLLDIDIDLLRTVDGLSLILRPLWKHLRNPKKT